MKYSKIAFTLAAITLASLKALPCGADDKNTKRTFFQYMQVCEEVMQESYWTPEKFWCIFGYPTSSMIDLVILPSQIAANPGKATQGSTDGTSTTQDSSHKSAPSPKEYKKSLLYAVADDAVYFSAEEGREASTALRKAIDMVRGDFPEMSDRQIAAHMVQAHLGMLEYYAHMN